MYFFLFLGNCYQESTTEKLLRKIEVLENKLDEMTNQLPKKFPQVKILNYKDRKRILVSRDIKNIPVKLGSSINMVKEIFYNFKKSISEISVGHVGVTKF